MISEFFHFDALPFYGFFTYKHTAIIPFVLGILMLCYSYLWWRPRHPGAVETM